MNPSRRLFRVFGLATMLLTLGAATHAQSLHSRHTYVPPRRWDGPRHLLTVGPRAMLPQWTASGPLVPRVLPVQNAAAPAKLGVSALAAAAPQPAWTSIGPAPQLNLLYGMSGYYNGAVSGRVSALAVDTTDANGNTFYVGAAGGGLWKTTDGGQNYLPLTDGQVDLATGAVAIAPSDHNRIYVGTGEANFTLDARYGLGVLASRDGGASFTTSFGPGGTFTQATISQIVVDPTTADTVYLTSGGSNINPNSIPGVYKSTDGGLNWALILQTTAPATDLVIDPTTPMTLYAAVGYPGNTTAESGVYKSTDGGGTWTQLAGFPAAAGDPLGRISLAIGGTTAPGTLYASVSSSATFGLLYVRKTTDSGATWTTPGTPPDYLGGNNLAGGEGFYANAIAVDPANPNIVYAGGVDDENGPPDNGIVGSTDGGATWTDYTAGTDANQTAPHDGHHALAFTPNGMLLDGNDGGMWRLEDPTQAAAIAWTDLNTNLSITQFNGIALDPTQNIAFGGAQNNGTAKFNGSPQWAQVRPGTGGFVRIDQDNPDTVYHTYSGLITPLERSDDGGDTNWTIVGNGLSGTLPNVYPFFILDPSQQTRVLYGTDYVNESTDRGDNFTPIGTPGTAGFNPNDDVIDSIGAIGQTVYAAAGNALFATTDDGGTWNDVSIPDLVNSIGKPIKDIYVSLFSPQTVYVVVGAFSGTTGQHVYRSKNGGQSWTDISGNLSDQPYNAIKVDEAAGTIYVGGDDGVYASSDGGGTWARYGLGLPNAQVVDLALNQGTRTLATGTHGRGMWLLALPGTAGTPNIVVQTAVTRDPTTQALTATLTFRNIGLVRATNLTISTVTADGVNETPSTTIVGNVPAAGTSAPVTVPIPSAPANSRVSIFVTGLFTEGGYNSRNSVVVP